MLRSCGRPARPACLGCLRSLLLAVACQASLRHDPDEDDTVRKYSKEQLLEAATVVHKWLTTEKCAFRAILRILSAGAVFYQAQMSDKTARAWLHPEGGKADLAHFQDAVLARHKPKEWAEARYEFFLSLHCNTWRQAKRLVRVSACS